MFLKKKAVVHYLPVFGCIATGIIYGAIGVIAILSFLRLKDGGADETSLLAFLNQYLAGKIVVLIILAGTVSYIIWRFYETFTDPYDYGNHKKGIAKRTGIALSSVADALIAFAAVRFLVGQGNQSQEESLGQQREAVSKILSVSPGQELVVSIGVVIIITALIQLLYGVTRGYRERLEIEAFSELKRKIIHFFAIYGYIARGIILGIIGFFYIKAGIVQDAGDVVNTDKAFDFIGDHVGHVYFILVAAGTVFYGFFMFALAIAYDIDKD